MSQADDTYLKQLQARYHKASKKEKGCILDEFVKTTGYHRKHATAVLNRRRERVSGPIRRPRRTRYGAKEAASLLAPPQASPASWSAGSPAVRPGRLSPPGAPRVRNSEPAMHTRPPRTATRSSRVMHWHAGVARRPAQGSSPAPVISATGRRGSVHGPGPHSDARPAVGGAPILAELVECTAWSVAEPCSAFVSAIVTT